MTVRLITRFGNPVLRQTARRLSKEEILSDEIQTLIADLHETVEKRKAGVGLAAPQIGESVALSLIAIKPTPNRPNLEQFESVIINPAYEGVGRRKGMWEGCVSSGTGKNTLFGKVSRYTKIRATWYDESASLREELLDGFVAHVFQHETDHLAGLLFVDKVRDTCTFMLADEYRKRIVKTAK